VPVERTGETVVGGDAPTIDPAVALGPELAAGLASVAVDAGDDAARWAASGAMALTGRAGGPPLPAPLGAATAVAAIGDWIAQRSTAAGRPVHLDAPAVLGERAAIAGFSRRGARSCGGGTRLLACADGWIAVTLARDDDIEAVPAWLEVDDLALDPWLTVEAAVGGRRAGDVLERAQLLGIPASALGEVPTPSHWAPAVIATHVEAAFVHSALTVRAECTNGGMEGLGEGLAGVRVVDLSSLWAGPLCAHVLGLAGADVVKVESSTRPDGARRGPAPFFDLLHHGQRAVAFDLAASEGQRHLRALLERADVVIEGSRRRALRQMGIGADELLATGRPRVWVSITGAGREGPGADRVSFGDDAAVAGGLVARDDDGPVFCADAIADPIAGLLAAAGALSALALPGGWLLDVALGRAAAYVAGGRSHVPVRHDLVAELPRARTPAGRAPTIGAHTGAVLAEWGVPAS
jgi:crotonobetainyl-CoA:carnitine CoA-transferase CaiB-like acyl-CoA transferase